MNKITIDCNEGFNIVPNGQISPVDEICVEDNELSEFMEDLIEHIKSNRVQKISIEHI